MLYLLLVWLVLYVLNIIYFLRNWRSMLADLEIVRIGFLMFMDSNKTKKVFLVISFVGTMFLVTPILSYTYAKATIKSVIKKLRNGKN